MGGYRVFFLVLSAHCMLFAKVLPTCLETPCGSQTPTLSEPQLPVVAFSCLEAGGFQECGINITREVFQAWLKDPEFVPQLPGGWVAESMAGWEVPLLVASLFWYVEFGSGQSPGRSRSWHLQQATRSEQKSDISSWHRSRLQLGKPSVWFAGSEWPQRAFLCWRKSTIFTCNFPNGLERIRTRWWILLTRMIIHPDCMLSLQWKKTLFSSQCGSQEYVASHGFPHAPAGPRFELFNILDVAPLAAENADWNFAVGSCLFFFSPFFLPPDFGFWYWGANVRLFWGWISKRVKYLYDLDWRGSRQCTSSLPGLHEGWRRDSKKQRVPVQVWYVILEWKVSAKSLMYAIVQCVVSQHYAAYVAFILMLCTYHE